MSEPNLEVLNTEIFIESEIGKIFEFVDCREYHKQYGRIEFPLDFTIDSESRLSPAYSYNKKTKKLSKYVNKDVLIVPIWKLNHKYNNIKNKSEQFITGSLLNEFSSRLTKIGWQNIKCAAEDRNIAIKTNGFNPKLVALMKTTMRRQGGNNSTSIRRNKLTDLYASERNIEKTADWVKNQDMDDYLTKREVIFNKDGTISRFCGVNFHITNQLSNSEVIGLDLRTRDNFVIPIERYFELNKEKTEVVAKIGMAILSNLGVLAGVIN